MAVPAMKHDAASNVIPLFGGKNRPSLWDRAQSIRQNLKSLSDIALDGVSDAAQALTEKVKTVKNSITKNDMKWAAGSIAVGAAAKVGVLAALGIGGSSLIAGAVVGGAVVGMTKQLVNHTRERLQVTCDPPRAWNARTLQREAGLVADLVTSKKFWMSTVSSTAISAATFGVLAGAEHVTGVNIAQTVSHKVGGWLSRAFDKVTDMVAESDFVKQESARMIKEGFDFSNGLAPSNAPAKLGPLDLTFDQHVAQQPAPEVVKPAGAHKTMTDDVRTRAMKKIAELKAAGLLKAAVAATPDPAPALAPAAPAVTAEAAMPAAPAAAPAPTPAPMSPQDILAKMKPKFGDLFTTGIDVDVQMPDNTVAHVKGPAVPRIADELARAQGAVNDQFVADKLREVIKDSSGTLPPADMSVEEMAKKISPRNADTMIAALARQAPQLDASKMAAACVTDVPTSQTVYEAQGRVVPTTCHSVKDMAEGDFVTVRDAGVSKPTATKGLKILFSTAKAKIADFIDATVTREAVPAMVPDFEAEAKKMALAYATAPNP